VSQPATFEPDDFVTANARIVPVSGEPGGPPYRFDTGDPDPSKHPVMGFSKGMGLVVLHGPVIVDAVEGSLAPQALSFKVRLDSPFGTLAVRRAGAAKELQPSFEISRPAAGEVSYLVAFDPRNGGGLALHGPTVVAEVELPARVDGGRLELDPAVTLLSDASGTRKATVANGALKLSGTDLAGRDLRPVPGKEIP